MSHLRIIISLAFAAALTACGPSYRTDYTLKAPVSGAGKECANSCYYIRQGCVNACGGAYSCAPNAGFSSGFGYASGGRSYGTFAWGGYPRGHHRHHYYDYCSDNRDICTSQCEADYRACFAGCGGEVIPNTYCTANCPAPAP